MLYGAGLVLWDSTVDQSSGCSRVGQLFDKVSLIVVAVHVTD